MVLIRQSIVVPEGMRAVINDAYRVDEHHIVELLLKEAMLDKSLTEAVNRLATGLMEGVREGRKRSTGIDSFLTKYTLSTEEGIALMCLAEALLRVPDNPTIDSLIKDKITGADWAQHRGKSDSFFVNATTLALMLTGKMLNLEKDEGKLNNALLQFVSRSSEAAIRAAVSKAMRIMGRQFVMGRTIQDALSRAKKKEKLGYRYSFDMLGEAALTCEDAAKYFAAYQQAIIAIGEQNMTRVNLYEKGGVSIKLSALHPRYQEAQHHRVLNELTPKLLSLAQLAKDYNIPFTIDAEESERLDLSLDLIERVFKDPSLEGWEGFGLALQSYQKRAYYVLNWIAALARGVKRRIMVRLIKGAYWDSEIKKAQVQGQKGYPVFTRKVFTDVSYQACAKKILTMTDAIYPQFATHNAYTVAMILNLVGEYRDFEFQCLHGMGKALYEQIVGETCYNIPCRIYAPVGSPEDLLPYLVRRLLENGANSSFVNRIVDDKAPISELVRDPIAQAAADLEKINQNIPLPSAIFMPRRLNSTGFDLSDRKAVALLQDQLQPFASKKWQVGPILAESKPASAGQQVYTPQDQRQAIGQVTSSTATDIEIALSHASKGFLLWTKIPVTERSAILRRFAELLEENRPALLTMACLEAGKTWQDGIAEIREAVDFCRYYAAEAERIMSQPMSLLGYTGELNELSLHGRGVILCISPWNFPLAIFVGQIVAALVTGNCVIAKPAAQTPLIAHFAVTLMLQAGIPAEVIQLLPGSGQTVGATLVADRRIKGIIFTGSTSTANHINQTIANRGEEIIPLIAETGGQNAMIVDSSALLEQVVIDVITSAFGSAGQRCSALRVLYVQDEIYPRLIELLKGAMAELSIGDPQWLTTDVGPVIDRAALSSLQAHVAAMQSRYEIIYQCPLTSEAQHGYFMPPTAIAIDSIAALDKEIFGPILHIIRYQRQNLDQVIAEINSTGYGLTLGIHSRINQTVEYIRNRVHVGNYYVNRNIIGAVVGLQPFGGERLSGTGPKAGGPHYLLRLCQERTYTVDTTAAGGNASLMSSPDM